MKKVCFVVPSFPTVTETFVTNQVLQAKLHGFQVAVLTEKILPFDASSQKKLLEEHHVLEKTYSINYKIPKAKIKRRFQSFILIVKYLKYWLRIKNIPFRNRFSTIPFQFAFYSQFKDVSVFHIQFAPAGLDLAVMKSVGLLKGHVVTTFHGYDAHFANNKGLKLLKERYRLLFNVSKYITANTPYLSNKLELLGANSSKIQVIPMGVDVDFFQSKAEKVLVNNTLIKLISVGRLIELKGFAYAIKSVKEILDKGYNVEYTIIGDGVEMDNLKLLISELKLMDNVFLLGVKNQIEIKSILEENHIFLMSSITDKTNRAEAQGVVTIEAQAMGLPVVAFNSGGVPFTILDKETGFLVQEKDVSGYADSIIKLLNNPSLYAMMSNAAKDFVKNQFSAKSLAQDFLKLYN